MILIVYFLFILLGGHAGWVSTWSPYSNYIALAIFAVTSLTNWIDSKISRKYHLITNFGKFMDPMADKMLVCSALFSLIEWGRIPAWAVIIIISREFVISGVYLAAADKGIFINGLLG